jgi:hypothetical protein
MECNEYKIEYGIHESIIETRYPESLLPFGSHEPSFLLLGLSLESSSNFGLSLLFVVQLFVHDE